MLDNYLSFITKLFKIKDKYSNTNTFNPFFGYCDDYILLENQNILKVLILQGITYSDKDKNEIIKLFNNRQNFLKLLNENINISIIAKNENSNINKMNKEIESHIEKIEYLHNKKFDDTYQINYYIVIEANIKHKTIFYETVNKLKSNFKEYEIRELGVSEMLSFYASYVNGIKTRITKSQDGLINNLSNSNIYIHNDHIEFQNPTTTIYAKFISIVIYQNDIFSIDLISILTSIQHNIEIYQNFSIKDKFKALKEVNAKINNLDKFESGNHTAQQQMAEIKDKLQAGDTSLFEYSFNIKIKSSSLEVLQELTTEVVRKMEASGYIIVVEKLNLEAIYISNMPMYHKFNVRKRTFQSDAIAMINSFKASNKGFSKNSFGDEPVTTFLTDQGKKFLFNLHNSSQSNALGHSLIVGGSNSGKTTFMCFILSQMTKYPKMKMLILDRLSGMEIFTKFYDGTYIDFQENGVSLNPLQLDDCKNNRLFILQLIKKMANSNVNDTKEEELIVEAIENMYSTLEKKDRNFKELLPLFKSSNSDNDLASRMKKWANKSSNPFFAGKTDGLKFDTKITSILMDKVITDKENAPLVSTYLFHRLKELADPENPSPSIIFIDELKEYLEDEYFLTIISELLTQARKLNMIILGAVQDIKYFTEHENAKKLIGSNWANFLLYPDSLATEQYQKTLSLSDNEFDFIKNTNERFKLLFKRVGGESDVLDISLIDLGNYLNVFNSGTAERGLLRKAIKENTKNEENSEKWKSDYLRNFQ